MSGDQIARTSDADLAPYRRGISFREIVRGALARFLPGSLITTVAGGWLLGLSVASDLFAAVGGLVGLAGGLTLGFGLGLSGLRPWLYPDANISGSRSFVAGLMSPLALFIAAVWGRGWTSAQLPFFVALVGAALALGMFFAWLTPTPEHMRPKSFQPDSSDELERLAERVA